MAAMATAIGLAAAADAFLRRIADGDSYDRHAFRRFSVDDLTTVFPFRGWETCLLAVAAKAAPALANEMLDAGADPCAVCGVGLLDAAFGGFDAFEGPSPERLRLVSRLALWRGVDVDSNEKWWVSLSDSEEIIVEVTPLVRAVWLAAKHRKFGPLRAVLDAGALLEGRSICDRRRRDIVSLVGRDRTFSAVVVVLEAERAARDRWGALRRAWISAVVRKCRFLSYGLLDWRPCCSAWCPLQRLEGFC